MSATTTIGKQDGGPVVVGAALIAWVALFAMATGAVEHTHGAAHVSWQALFGMWVLMAVAMMLPTALPLVSTYGSLPLPAGDRARCWPWMVAGYLAVWTGFAAAGALAQSALAHAGVVSVDGRSTSAILDTALLTVAALYHFSALRAACLTRCRAPLTFLIEHWRSGRTGAFCLGLRHGLDCLGCCWALMALAFVGGTMNLAWMGVATVLMTVEKLPVGRKLSGPLGAVLMIAAAASAVRVLASPA